MGFSFTESFNNCLGERSWPGTKYQPSFSVCVENFFNSMMPCEWADAQVNKMNKVDISGLLPCIFNVNRFLINPYFVMFPTIEEVFCFLQDCRRFSRDRLLIRKKYFER